LTAKQQKFISEYLIDLNATQAAIRAGYSKKTARSIGQNLLTKVDIQEAIQEKQLKLREKAEITTEQLAFLDPRKIMNPDGSLVKPYDLPEETARAISGIEVIETYDFEGNKTVKYKFRFWDKGRSLERISKYLGVYTENEREDALKIIIESSDKVKIDQI